MTHKNPTNTVLYTIEEASKEYRKLCQRNIDKLVPDMTVDQCLILIVLNDGVSLSQKEIAELVLKDTASVTRMIELMVQKEYLKRSVHKTDRRKFQLSITPRGRRALEKLTPVVQQNRTSALKGLTEGDLKNLSAILQKIIANCQSR